MIVRQAMRQALRLNDSNATIRMMSTSSKRSFPPRECTQRSVRRAFTAPRRVPTIADVPSPSETRKAKGFPERQESLEKIESGKFNELAAQFQSLGRFVNYCVTENLPVNAKTRRNVMAASLEPN